MHTINPEVGKIYSINFKTVEPCNAIKNETETPYVKITCIDEYGNLYYNTLDKNKHKVYDCCLCVKPKDILPMEEEKKEFKYGSCQAGDIIVDKDGDEAMILGAHEMYFVRSLFGNFEEAKPNFLTYQEAINNGWTLKEQQEETHELGTFTVTLQQVADKFNTPVDKLRIKE